MNNILVVVENEASTKLMLEKSLKFLPEEISVLYLENSTSGAANVQAMLNDLTYNRCNSEMITSSDSTDESNREIVSHVVSQLNPDMVVVHRPRAGSGKQEYSLINAILRSASQSSVLLSGNTAWKSKMKVVATFDMVDDSSSQQLLNAKVLDVAIEVLGITKAELTLMSVLEISRIRDELEIALPTDLMATKGKDVKTKLSDMIKTKDDQIAFSTYVSVGVTSKEISSVTQKLKSNLVIMGNVGRTGIKGLIVGNTAEKILDRLAVDALIVKM